MYFICVEQDIHNQFQICNENHRDSFHAGTLNTHELIGFVHKNIYMEYRVGVKAYTNTIVPKIRHTYKITIQH